MASNDLFAPVAQKVGAQVGRCFGAIDGGATVSPEQDDVGFFFIIPFTDGVSVEQFAQQVAVPPGGEVAGAGAFGGDTFALGGVETTGGYAPAFVARVSGINVSRHA